MSDRLKHATPYPFLNFIGEEFMSDRFRECDKFDSCSANVCPLRSGLQRRDGTWIQQHKNDATCQHCRAVAKNAVGTIPDNIREQVVLMYPVMIENCGSAFRKEMNRASKTPMKQFK